MNSPTPSLTPEQEAKILTVAVEKGPIAAIKAYRELTGAGLAEAKNAVEQLMAGPPKRDEPTAPPLPQSTAFRSEGPAPEQQVELLEMLRQGAKIPAIKRYREITGSGLKEAKEAVEELALKHGLTIKSGPCFVATAVFEDANAPEVVALRHWRDTRLVQSLVGRIFVRVYAVLGPRLAHLPQRSLRLRALLRILLSCLARRLRP